MQQIEMVVFDMAGTTVCDKNEVEKCFVAAAENTGLEYCLENIISMMGWSKRLVFETLWKQNLPGEKNDLIQQKTDTSYNEFKAILEKHYKTEPVFPTDGTLEIFAFLKSQGIKIVLTTGFYRNVTDIILTRLGWGKGLDNNYIGGSRSVIDLSVSSDQVPNGRPAPDMIFRAMQLLGVKDAKKVIKIGDTPSDLQAGKNANCLLSLGVTNGTHTKEQLEQYPNDGLIENISQLKQFL